MHIETGELQSAITAVEQAKGGNIDSSLAEGFLAKLGDKQTRMPFVEALRYSLNESYIHDKKKRVLYASLAGKFYGRRGNAVRRANRAQGRTLKKKPPRAKSPIQFTEEKNGQRAFVI